MNHFKLVRLGIETECMLRELGAISHAMTVAEGSTVEQRMVGVRIRAPLAGSAHAASFHYTSLSQRLPAIRRQLQQMSELLDMDIGAASVEYYPPGFYRQTPAAERSPREHRYRLVLFSPRGSCLRCGGEEVRMRPGELWCFDHRAEYADLNETPETCVHLSFDLVRRKGYESGWVPALATHSRSR